MFGNEHRVNNIKEIRSDLDDEKIKKEVEESNALNKSKLDRESENDGAKES